MFEQQTLLINKVLNKMIDVYKKKKVVDSKFRFSLFKVE